MDKYFELYKPGGGTAGGFIRVAISHLDPSQVRSGAASGSVSRLDSAAGSSARRRGGKGKGKG